MTEPAENTAVAERPTTELAEFRGTVDRMGDQFLAALPQHVSVDKFKRTVITAVTNSPDLLQCDRRSLLSSVMRCASDGLLPDGREAAIVRFKSKDGPMAQYQPMVGGLLKRMRQSDEVKDISVDCVYRGDDFDHWRDEDGEHLTHRPQYNSETRRDDDILVTYAIVQTITGGKYIRVLDRAAIEKARAVSKATYEGRPWQKWYPQMCQKTALKAVAKIAPMSTDVLDFIKRDNEETIDLHQHDETRVTQPQRARPRVLDAVAGIGHETPPDESAMAAAVAEDEQPKPNGGTI